MVQYLSVGQFITKRVEASTELLLIDMSALVLVKLSKLGLDFLILRGADTTQLLELNLLSQHLGLGRQEIEVLAPENFSITGSHGRVTVVLDACLINLGLSGLPRKRKSNGQMCV